MTLGDKLIELRKKKKMTQEEVADSLNVTRQTISNWELNQTKPDLDQLKGLSKLYAISIDNLVDNDIKEALTERISNTEKLTGLIYKILKVIVIGFFVLIGMTILSVILFSANNFESKTEQTTIINCNLNNDDYTFQVKISENNKVIELKGDATLIDSLALKKYEDSNQILDKLSDYFIANGGSCD